MTTNNEAAFSTVLEDLNIPSKVKLAIGVAAGIISVAAVPISMMDAKRDEERNPDPSRQPQPVQDDNMLSLLSQYSPASLSTIST